MLQQKTSYNNFNNGYIAVSSVLIILIVVILIGISTSLISISDTQLSLAAQKTEESFNEVFSCVEEALLVLNKEEELPASVTMPFGTCSINLENQDEIEWTFTIENPSANYFRKLRIRAERANVVSIIDWEEV